MFSKTIADFPVRDPLLEYFREIDFVYSFFFAFLIPTSFSPLLFFFLIRSTAVAPMVGLFLIHGQASSSISMESHLPGTDLFSRGDERDSVT